MTEIQMKQNSFFKILIAVISIYIINTSTVGAQDKVIDQVVAVIGNNIILKSDIENEFASRQRQGQTSEGDIRCEILENLMVNNLLITEAELDTLIEVTPNQINQQTDRYMQMYIQQAGSERALENSENKTIAEIRAGLMEVVKNQILANQMSSKIIQDVAVTPSEVRLFYRNLSQDDIPQIPEQYEYKQITIKPEITLEEENEIKANLREIKRRIESGERSFAAMAIAESDDPSSALNGGELPYYGRAELDENFAAVAFNLRDDRISNVVKSNLGYHIIQLIDRQGDRVKVRHILKRPRASIEAREEAYNRLDSLANMIRRNEVTFEDAAMVVSSDANTKNNGGLAINLNTMSSKFSLEELDPDVSKILPNMNINEISEPFETIDEESQQAVYKIIKLVNKTNSHKANLQEDYQLIADAYLQQKQHKVLEDWIAEQQSDMYIRIDETYANCNFTYKNWIK